MGSSNRIPEAAFFARTYLPSEVSRVVDLWRTQLGKVSEKAGQSLADPKDYPNLFPDFQASLQAEAMLKKERGQYIPAGDYLEILPNHERNPIDEAQGQEKPVQAEVERDEKDHPIKGKSDEESNVVEDLEAELEADLENMKLDDIDASDLNLDDEGLL